MRFILWALEVELRISRMAIFRERTVKLFTTSHPFAAASAVVKNNGVIK
jgi:hypothetical protein